MGEVPKPDDDRPDLDDVIGDGQQHDAVRRQPMSADELREVVPEWNDDWKSLPKDQREAYVLTECAAGRWLPLMARQDAAITDAVLDLGAMVRACRENNMTALVHLFKHASVGACLMVAVKAIAEHLEESQSPTDYWIVWSSHCQERQS